MASCPGSGPIVESDYNDSVMRTAACGGNSAKRSGPSLENMPPLKKARLQVGPRVSLPLRGEGSGSDHTPPVLATPVSESPGSHPGELPPPLERPGLTSSPPASSSAPIPPQRPKVAEKKKTTIRRLPMSWAVFPEEGLHNSPGRAASGPPSHLDVAGDGAPASPLSSERGLENFPLVASLVDRSVALGHTLEAALAGLSSAMEAGLKVKRF